MAGYPKTRIPLILKQGMSNTTSATIIAASAGSWIHLGLLGSCGRLAGLGYLSHRRTGEILQPRPDGVGTPAVTAEEGAVASPVRRTPSTHKIFFFPRVRDPGKEVTLMSEREGTEQAPFFSLLRRAGKATEIGVGHDAQN